MNFPISTVREQFPALALCDNGVPRVYLDNPAGTQVPLRVAQAASRCLLESNANLGGAFVTSREAEAIVEDAHSAMARFLHAAGVQEIIIGPSMTSLTFAISRSIGRLFSPGDEIVVTRMDHEGNVSPWLALAEDCGLVVRWVPFDEQHWRILPDALDAVLTSRTKLVALNYASNLTGSINDVQALVQRVHAAGALAYVDAVQFAPHGKIDVQTIGCDFLTCSSYKFYGPHLGILWGKADLLASLYPYKVRPQTDALPYRFETGTPQIELLAALGATVEYWESLGEAPIEIYERSLAAQLVTGLQRIAGVRVIGITDQSQFRHRVPTVSFVHEQRNPTHIAHVLARQNIFVWSGHNFALEVVRQLGLDEEQGVVRIGMAHYNTAEEIDRALQAVEDSITAPVRPL